MSNLPQTKDVQRLAFDYQQALVRLKEADERSRVLLEEIDRLNHRLDGIQSSTRMETDNRLRAEEALDDTRERLQLAVEATNLVLWDFRAPFQDFFLTAKWGELLGEVALEGNWSVELLKSRSHPDDFPAIEQGIGALLAGQRERGVVEFRFRARDRWIWIESHGIVAERDASGRPTCLLGTLTDISERKEHESSLAQARELADRASKAKSDFLTNISHEIRTPLNALMGLNSLLLDSTSLTDEQRHWLELMSRSSQSLLKLLNDLLDLSRIEAGKLTLEESPFELLPFLQSACALFAEQSKFKEVRFDQRWAPDLPPAIVGDPGRLGQVLNNLLSNAIKFTPAGGEVVIEASVKQAGADSWLVFGVHDSGIGISEDVIKHLFKAFTQADASIANRFGGSGMGLAISASLVELMQGQMRVESQAGQGSHFYVSLPLRRPVASPLPLPLRSAPYAEIQTAALPQEMPFSGLVVLLAEDHPVNELVMRQMLSKLGCTIEVAHNGLEAVEMWQRGGFDLVLMDVQMPECNGLMATERIRSLERTAAARRTPIIALTANAMIGDRDRCVAAGMDGYVAKPVKMEILVRAMQESLGPSIPSIPDVSAAPCGTPATVPQPSDVSRPGLAAVDVEIEMFTGVDDDDLTSDLAQLSPMIKADVRERMAEMDAALLAKDAVAAHGAAHKLMSTLGLIEGERGVRLCRGLEMAADAGEWNLFARALPLLREEVKHLLSHLEP